MSAGMHIHSRFDRVVSEFALSLLAQTRVYVIVAIVFVFMAVVLQVMGRIKKIKIAKTLERTGVLFASISSKNFKALMWYTFNVEVHFALL